MDFYEKWGIPGFDERVGGLPTSSLNIVESPDHRTGLAMVGHYMQSGLDQGEKVVYISLETPIEFVESYDTKVFDFLKYLKSGQLVFLNYDPSVTLEIGLNQDYEGLFDEIVHLSGGDAHRIIFQQVDTLFSLHNTALITTCAHKFAAQAGHIPPTVMGQFIQFGNETHMDLSIACQKVASGHFKLEKGAEDKEYFLNTVKVPWHEYDDRPLRLIHEPGEGFSVAELATGKVG